MIYFINDTFDWEQRKLISLTNIENSKRIPITENKRQAGDTPYYGATGIQDYVKGYTHNGNYVLIAEDGASDLNNYPVNIVSGKIWVNNHAHIVTGKKESMDNNFLANYLHSINYSKYVTGSSRYKLNRKTLENIIIVFPTYSEQLKIGKLLKTVNKLFTLYQRKLEKLEELKNAFLQQLFPTEGKVEPCLRFDKFNGYWEQHRLDNIGELKSGIGFPNIEQGGNTGIPFYKVSDMMSNGNEKQMTSANNYVTDEQIKDNKWQVIDNGPSIIFAKVGAAIMLNRKRLVYHPFLIDNNMMAFVIDDDYLNFEFSFFLFQNIFLPRYSQVGALPSYNSSDIGTVSKYIPTKYEQNEIAKFFLLLEEIGTLYQKKLNNFLYTKKELLNKMFV